MKYYCRAESAISLIQRFVKLITIFIWQKKSIKQKKTLNCFKQALTWGEEDMLTVRSPSDTINRRRICCQSWSQHSRSWPNLDSSILSPSHDSSSIPTPSTTKVELTIETNSTEAGNIFREFLHKEEKFATTWNDNP